MTKKKKRFFTAHQIREEIERYKVKQQKLMDQAAALDIKADQLFQNGDPALLEDANYAREQAKKSRRSAQRIQEVRLPKLKGKLAEILTEVIPGVLDPTDTSIQA